MSEEKEKKQKNEWKQTKNFGALQNLMPILKATLLILEEEKKKTVNKIDELKKMRDKSRNG